MLVAFRCVAIFAFIGFVTVSGQDSAAKLDLTIPKLPPKPLVWLDDYQPRETKLTQEQQNAKVLLNYGNRFKAGEQFEEAEEAYLSAIKYDPTLAFAHYQLACNYELWGKSEKAAEQFRTALKKEFSAFPTALSDSELGSLRKRPEFKTQLATLRKKYIDSSGERVGQPVAIPAKGKRPAKGWPVIVMLHGYGDTNLSYVDNAQRWADAGFVAIALPGSVPSLEGRYIWDLDSTKPTSDDIDAALASPLLDIDRSRVHLLGFSQGALHALLLAKSDPKRIAGVVAISPGGSLSDQLYKVVLPSSNRKPKCFFVHAEREPHAPVVQLWGDAYKKAGWEFESATHPGGHHFPEDWDTMRKHVIDFLR